MNTVRSVLRWMLGALMLFAGVAHLTFARRGFRVAVPEWVPGNPDTTVVASGVVEIGLGAAMIASPAPRRPLIGALLAGFLIAVFPGNIAQWRGHKDAFGLASDRARFVRLWLQPVLVLWAIWSTRSSDRS